MNGQPHKRSALPEGGRPEDTSPNLARQLEQYVRGASQLVGLGLLLVGACYALYVFADIWMAVRDPARLEPALTSMAQLLDAPNLTIPVQEEKVPLGKVIAIVVLLFWYLICVWVPLALLSAGGKLVLAVRNERREFLAAMKEFLVTLRQEGTDAKPKGGA